MFSFANETRPSAPAARSSRNGSIAWHGRHHGADEHDSGRIHVLPDGSVSIPIYSEELIVTRRTVLKERVIIRKEITTETTNVTTELHAEHVEIDSEGRVDIVGDIG